MKTMAVEREKESSIYTSFLQCKQQQGAQQQCREKEDAVFYTDVVHAVACRLSLFQAIVKPSFTLFSMLPRFCTLKLGEK